MLTENLNHSLQRENPLTKRLTYIRKEPGFEEVEHEEVLVNTEVDEDNLDAKIAQKVETMTQQMIDKGMHPDMARELAEQMGNDLKETEQGYVNKIDDLTGLLKTDSLTKLGSKRGYYEQIKIHLGLAKRQNEKNVIRMRNGETPEPSKLSLLMVDIDKFKRVNDILGHDEGDKVLKAFGEVMLETVRESDYPARIGGEEFMVIFPQTNGESVIGAERLKKAMEARLKPLLDKLLDEFVEKNGIRALFEPLKGLGLLEELGIGEKNNTKYSELNEEKRAKLYTIAKKSLLGTVSIGVSTYKAKDNEESLRIRADKALYKAKQSGRNRVINANGEKEYKKNTEDKQMVETSTKPELLEKSEKLARRKNRAERIRAILEEDPDDADATLEELKKNH